LELEILEARTVLDSGIHKIQHVIVITQENHSFDNYFGTYPGADGIPMQNGVPTVQVYDPTTGTYVKPFYDPTDTFSDPPHNEAAALTDLNGGKMDGFLQKGESQDVMGYVDYHQIPNYWTYAQDFVLQDHFFEPVLSWSQPSHLYLVSAWSAYGKNPYDPLSFTNDPAGYTPSDSSTPIYGWTDLTYLLAKNNVSWAYYMEPGNDVVDPDDGTTPLIWNPLSKFTDVLQDNQLANIQDSSNFFEAAADGTLPAVSWVVPNYQSSEHSPNKISDGQAWVTSLINAVMQGPDWDSSAIFLNWDDWGGYYDHVAPPVIDQDGYGFRVPGMVISPYAKQGYIDHQTLSTDGYLKFIEDDFLNGQRLDPTTDGRPDRRPDVRENSPQLGDLVSDFDFSQAPRAPVLLPLRPTSITADAGGPYTIQEGQSLTLDGSGTFDPLGRHLSYDWDVDGDKLYGDAGGVNPTLTWSQLQAAGVADAGTYWVRLKVFTQDFTAIQVSEEVPLTVAGVPPDATIGGPATGFEGLSYTLNLSAVYSGDPDGDTVTGWTINWGDGSTSTVTGNPPTVTHTYTGAGAFTVLAAAQDGDGSYAAGNNVSVVVAGSPLSITLASVTAAENASFSGAVATFTDAAGAGPTSTYTVTISWGDGQNSAATLTPTGTGGFTAGGTHTYTEEGTYAVSVTVQDLDGASVGASGLAVISDAALAGSPKSISALPNTAFSGVIAAFRDPGGDGTVNDYTASINWGDGQSSKGTVVADGAGGFLVWGGHTFATVGTYHPVVTIQDAGGASTQVDGTVLVASTGLEGTAESLTATEGAAFNGVVAAFRDPDGSTTATGYTANVNWGDGQTTAGTVAADGSGGFTVTATHTYAEEGPFNPVVTIQDTDGASAVVTSSALVSDAALQTAPPPTLQATEGLAFSGVVAAFRDPGGDGTVADYSATIAWGDGQKSAGTIAPDGSGGFTVSAGHTYAEEGTDHPVVTIHDAGGASAQVTSTVTVADAALQASAETFSAVPGTPFSGVLASFRDPGSDGTTGDYSASIAWGDGQTSAGSVTADGSGGFLVGAGHTYAQTGIYRPVITIQDVGGASVQVTATVIVSTSALLATPETVRATENMLLSGTVAAFRDPDGNSALTAYTASVAWGDGQTSNGTVASDGSGGFIVRAAHTYTEEGTYSPVITIQDTDGALAAVTSTVLAGDAALQASGKSLQATENAALSATFAAFRDPGGDGTLQDYTASIAWGDGQTSPATVASDGSGGFLVNASHTYAEEGTYHPTITLQDAGGASAQVAATVVVADATLQATGGSVVATAGTPFGGVVATFTDPSGDGAVNDYTALIAWGDGQTSPGTVAPDGSGGFTVSGANTYAQEGRYAVTVTITDVGTSTATATATAHVARTGPLPGGIGAVASMFTHSAEYYGTIVVAAYQNYLGRSPSAAETSAWVTLMQNGLTDEHLEAGFIGSPEYIANHGGPGAGWVTGMYQNLLGRNPSQAEVNAWVQALNAGASPTEIAYDFAASPEREGQRVTADYDKYLGRAPSTAEVNAWVTAFENGFTNEDVIAGFVGSPEYFQTHYDNITDWVYSAYQDILGRQPGAAELQAWVNFLKNT
jgi:phospholipase C